MENRVPNMDMFSKRVQKPAIPTVLGVSHTPTTKEISDSLATYSNA